jgi:hypothetical protein
MTCPVCGAFNAAGPTHCLRCRAALPSSAARSPTVTDYALARSLGEAILLGRAFVFASKTAFEKPGLRWVQRFLGGARPARSLVISLFDRDAVELPGATMSPPDLPRLSLGAVTSDKALYREARDEVHLLALDPLAGGAEIVIELRASGVAFRKQPALLDARGAASVTLRDLPPGDYEARLLGAPESAPACAFTVASYRLAPLVASLVDRRLEGPLLAVKLRLESFGTPIDGKVKLQLTDRGARLDSVTAEARAGVVEASFTIFGEGPHAINAQLVSDPGRTATVPIVGSRAAERSRTVFSPLGVEVTGSLLPSEGATPVRGIFLSEGAVRATPFRLERVDAGRARLTAVAAVETAQIVILDPTAPLDGPRTIALDDVVAGQVIDLDVPGPMALVLIGAWIDGAAWEGWATVITKETIAPSITAPATAAPGGDAVIHVATGRATDDASVYVVIKDARLLTPDTPASRLAGGLKAFAEAAGHALAVGAPTRTLASAIPTPPPPSMPYEANWDELDGMPLPALAAPRGMVEGAAPSMLPQGARSPSVAPPSHRSRSSVPASAPRRSRPPGGRTPSVAPKGAIAGPYREASAQTPPSFDEPEVLFAGLVATQGGRATVSVRLGRDFADYLVEAFVIAGTDWAPAEARFRAEKDVFVSLDLPAFVHPQDSAVGRVHVGALGEGARVRVTHDGAAVLLHLDGVALDPGAPLATTRAELSFVVAPGRWEATIEDASGPRDSAAKDVEIPGKIRRIARAVRFLQPGESASLASDPSVVGLRVLPGLDRPFRALVDATADYGHACCEQTAAKMLAASAMYALAEDAERRGRAEAILLAGVRREEGMWLRGRGFKMYPESAAIPDSHWGALAARHLWSLGLLRSLRGPAAPGRALAQAIDEALAMADDASRAYGLAWPPTAPRTCEEAYATICFGPEGARAAAIDRVRQLAGRGDALLASASPQSSGAVGMRAESAYAAAALLRAGGPSTRALALALANAVIGALGEDGRLYSTVDSVAAIALMVELRAAAIVGAAGLVEIDGARVTTAEAVAHAGTLREVRAVDGVTAVEVARVVEEDWEKFSSKVALRVALEKNGAAARRSDALAALDLVVKLESGYQPGDLCWVCLPDALSRVVGGGQVKRFSVDFKGRDEVRIPLAATGATVNREGNEAPAHFAVCVRNMFEEERGGNPGLLSVTVLAPTGGGLLGWAAGALRGLFGG